MVELNETLIYDGEGDYLGKDSNKSLDKWIKQGIKNGFQFMYKGYNYYDNNKRQVVVFTNDPWDTKELARRKKNGFMGIREYILY